MDSVERLLKWFLVLVAIHTFGVGVVLIVAGHHVMGVFGFPHLETRFFQMQGGVFNLFVRMSITKQAPISNDMNILSYTPSSLK